ncbi:hypothetical protein LT493_29980 [Streptomyces tricolor]|nr:hypothetical protein [Streptomyces tricolor]
MASVTAGGGRPCWDRPMDDDSPLGLLFGLPALPGPARGPRLADRPDRQARLRRDARPAPGLAARPDALVGVDGGLGRPRPLPAGRRSGRDLRARVLLRRGLHPGPRVP